MYIYTINFEVICFYCIFIQEETVNKDELKTKKVCTGD